MVKKAITVKLDGKKDSMPVAMLVQIAGQFESSIYVDAEEKRVNAKSIMGMMTLGLRDGLKIVVTADGADEEKAVESIEAYFS